MSANSSTALEVVGADSIPDESWDRFVAEHPNGSVYHLSAWKEILERSYRFKPHGLALTDAGSGELAGVMPLLRGSGPVSGSRLNSLPVVRWAGPVATDADGEAMLLRAACGLVDAGVSDRLQLTSPEADLGRHQSRLVATEAPPAWWLSLPNDLESFRDGFRRRSRSLPRNVRRAEREGVTVREGRSRQDLRDFYRLYLQTMRRLGVLPRSFRQLTEAQRLLGPPGIFRLFVAELQGRVVAGGVFHFFRDTVDLLYNASDDRYLQARPNYALYWEVIRVAIEQGMRVLDFGAGRPGSSLAEFKRRWGAEPIRRWQYTYPAEEGEGRAGRVTGAAAWIAEGRRIGPLWRRLPLAATRVAGSVAYRYL